MAGNLHGCTAATLVIVFTAFSPMTECRVQPRPGQAQSGPPHRATAWGAAARRRATRRRGGRLRRRRARNQIRMGPGFSGVAPQRGSGRGIRRQRAERPSEDPQAAPWCKKPLRACTRSRPGRPGKEMKPAFGRAERMRPMQWSGGTVRACSSTRSLHRPSCGRGPPRGLGLRNGSPALESAPHHWRQPFLAEWLLQICLACLEDTTLKHRVFSVPEMKSSGTAGRSARRRLARSRPPISGITMSITTRSTCER